MKPVCGYSDQVLKDSSDSSTVTNLLFQFYLKYMHNPHKQTLRRTDINEIWQNKYKTKTDHTEVQMMTSSCEKNHTHTCPGRKETMRKITEDATRQKSMTNHRWVWLHRSLVPQMVMLWKCISGKRFDFWTHDLEA